MLHNCHVRPTLLAVLLLCLGANAAHADTLSKSEHTLWNPTPRSECRAMSADRPDFTESPYTVDAGAFQLEMSFVDYSQTDDADDFNFFTGISIRY
jgi:hypothetical protein